MTKPGQSNLGIDARIIVELGSKQSPVGVPAESLPVGKADEFSAFLDVVRDCVLPDRQIVVVDDARMAATVILTTGEESCRSVEETLCIRMGAVVVSEDDTAGVSLVGRIDDWNVDLLELVWTTVAIWIVEGNLVPLVDNMLAHAETHDAFQRMANGVPVEQKINSFQ